MRKQPIFIITICFILGICFQDNVFLGEDIVMRGGIVALVLLVFIFIENLLSIFYKRIFLCVLFFILGISLHFFNQYKDETPKFSGKTSLVFKLNQKLKSNDQNRRYEVTIYKDSFSFKSILSIPKSQRELDFMHYYKSDLWVNKVEPPSNDYQFNYAKFLSRQMIFHQARWSGGWALAGRQDLSIWESIRQKRLEVLHNIDEALMSTKSKNFLKGIILADRTEMDHQITESFTQTGLVHILAISGAHIAVIFGWFYFVLTRFFPIRYRTAIVISLLSIWLFAIFVDMGNSVARACIMLTIYNINVLLYRKPDMLHSLALTSLLILVIDTHQFFDVGFQLSFLAVLGIFWFNRTILNWFPKTDNFFIKLFFDTISISFSAQLATLPLVLYYFHQFSFISIVANVVIIPFAQIFIIMSFVMAFLSSFGFYFNGLEVFYSICVEALLAVIDWFAGFSILLRKGISLHLLELFLLFVIAYFLKFSFVKFNFMNLKRVLVPLFVFILARLGINFYYFQKEEVVVHQYFKHQIFSIKKKEKIIFWIDETANQKKVMQYVVEPYSTKMRTNNLEVNTLLKEISVLEYEGKQYILK